MYVAKHKDSFKIINKSEVETFNGSGPVPNLALGRSQVISRLPPPCTSTTLEPFHFTNSQGFTSV
jgi:hypothetical protein